MRWPWKRDAEVVEKAAKAEAQSEDAKREYERTVAEGSRVAQVLAALFAHAEHNQFSEKIQKVARGH